MIFFSVILLISAIFSVKKKKMKIVINCQNSSKMTFLKGGTELWGNNTKVTAENLCSKKNMEECVIKTRMPQFQPKLKGA
jgi:hypothetical protein